MTSTKLAIIGAGGHGRVVADSATAAGWRQISFFDDGFPQLSSTGHWIVEGRGSDLCDRVKDFDGIIVAIGNNNARLDWHERLKNAGAPLICIFHPRSCLSEHTSCDEGVFVAPGAIINIGASIGAAVIINTGATIDHDCSIEEGVHVAPGVHMSGGVTVGRKSWIGVGAVIRQGINIGSNAMIGAGAVVVSDIPDGVTAIGCPARARI